MDRSSALQKMAVSWRYHLCSYLPWMLIWQLQSFLLHSLRVVHNCLLQHLLPYPLDVQVSPALPCRPSPSLLRVRSSATMGPTAAFLTSMAHYALPLALHLWFLLLSLWLPPIFSVSSMISSVAFLPHSSWILQWGEHQLEEYSWKRWQLSCWKSQVLKNCDLPRTWWYFCRQRRHRVAINNDGVL